MSANQETANSNPIADRRIWVRLLYMLLMWFAFSIAELLLAIVAIFQVVVTAVTGKVNAGMHRFGQNLSIYVTQITQFVTFNSEELPFPFNDWPDAAPQDTHWSEADPEPAPPPAPAPVSETPAAAPAEPAAPEDTAPTGSSDDADEVSEPNGDTPKA